MSELDLYLFAGGGTGGHLTPGLAVAQRLRDRLERTCRIVFVGTDRPVERELITAHRYEHLVLPVESSVNLRRRPWSFVWRNWQAYRRSATWLQAERPRAVIGLGGFASVPMVWAATRQQIPTLILEQNSIPGRANRCLSRRVDAVCLAFAESQSRLPVRARVELTGNPVRSQITALVSQSPISISAKPPTILILGGSQGAAGVNNAVMRLLPLLPPGCRDTLFVHQTGPGQCGEVRSTYSRENLRHVVEPFFPELHHWYAQATLAISRAGATTLAELACAGCPAVLVPFPHAAEDHQTRNADIYVKAGAARLVKQSPDPEVTARNLLRTMTELRGDCATHENMGRAMRALARPDAAGRVVALLQSLTAGAMT